MAFEEDEAYLEYLKELEQADHRKEYNLRKNANTRLF